MYISELRIHDHKSFRDSGPIRLTPGFTVVLGKNDAGKSAFVEAVSLGFLDKPHRSPKTIRSPGAPYNSNPRVQVCFTLTHDEVKESLKRLQTFSVPTTTGPSGDSAQSLVYHLMDSGADITATWARGRVQRAWVSEEDPGDIAVHFLRNDLYPDVLQMTYLGTRGGDVDSTLAAQLFAAFKDRIYSFKAERTVTDFAPIQGSEVLQPNASNLADVLLMLTAGNANRRDRFLKLVNAVFPHITYVNARPLPSTDKPTARIYVHSVPVEHERDDLAVPLAESGTGIGQVLAILYVVVTADTPRVIVIDEPQSFLHPGAVRKLLDILRYQFPQHQYIITTHSPIPLGKDGRDSVLILRREGYETMVERVDHSVEHSLRVSLAEVGARLSDVFGADAVLWVEGKTEEVCFPKLIRQLVGAHLLGVQVLGVVSTDELAHKQAERMFDIYGRLSGGNALLPQALAFVLDMEERNEAQREDIERRSGGKIRWLPKRMYENYLLVPWAIAELINREDAERSTQVTKDEVSEWIKGEGARSKYHRPLTPCPSTSPKWEMNVRGANILADLFDHFTECRVRYSKVAHGEALTEILINNPTPDLVELARMLADIVQQGGVNGEQ